MEAASQRSECGLESEVGSSSRGEFQVSSRWFLTYQWKPAGARFKRGDLRTLSRHSSISRIAIV